MDPAGRAGSAEPGVTVRPVIDGGMIGALRQRWQGLSRRERRIVQGAAIVLLLLFSWLWLFEPAWQGRQALRARLPVLLGQLAEVDRLAAVARELSGRLPDVAMVPVSRQQIETSLARAGLSPMVTVAAAGERSFDLRFDAVPYPLSLVWLDAAAREMRLRVVDVSLERAAEAGRVSGRIVLEAVR